MRFEENKAKVGPVVYLSDGDVCQWNSLTSPYFSTDLQKTWTFMDIGWVWNYIIFAFLTMHSIIIVPTM